jgi:spermidine/putrescine transport system substrate-binding protein
VNRKGHEGMADRNDEHMTRILAPASTAQRVSRRLFLQGGAVALFSGSVLLAACGSDDTTGGTSPTAGGDGASPVLEDQLNFYHWAEYDDPKIFQQFTDEFGPQTKIDIYASNEEMIAKLVAAAGTAGYDIVVPTGVYIPQMVSQNLLAELDLSKIPNFSNLETQYTNQPWDPNNAHSVCKDWGSTGWIYDTEAISTPIETWSDFIAAAQGPASGKTSVLDAPTDLAGIYFWANGIPWTTENKEDLDACQAFIVDQLAPHIKAYDSYPGITLTQGNYALSQIWNGDARQGLIDTSEKDPNRYKWVLGAPKTELWMDNWSILAEAQNTEAAYAWINFILQPEVSLKDLEFHGYNTGIKGVKEEAEAADLPYLDVVFFDEAQVATMEAGAVNSAQQQLVEIWDQAKVASGTA